MTGVERVRRAIHFGGPDRVPFWGVESPDFTEEVNLGPSLTFEPASEAELRRRVKGDYDILRQNEWGSISGGFLGKPGGEPVAPAFDDWDQADAFQWPDVTDPRRYEQGRRVFAANTDGKYNLVVCPGVKTGLSSLFYGMRTMERYLLDMGLHQEEMIAFQEKGSAVDIQCLRLWKEAGAHGVLICDDLGTQERLLASPESWRRVFRPFQHRWLEAGHELGLDMILHSCGYIWDLIPDLIDVGWDVLQIDQPRALGIQSLGQAFGGKVCFYCPVDIQATLPTGDKTRIQAEARDLMHMLGRFDGGFMAKDYIDWKACGIDDQWAAWARQAFLRDGSYPFDIPEAK